MNNIQIFQNNQFGQIRVATNEAGEPLFCLADLCKALSLTTPSKVKDRLDPGDVSSIHTPTTSGVQSITFVTEAGLYDVILRSDSPQAKPMRKWVTSEILPSIRKHGGYLTPSKIEEVLLSPDTIIRLATDLKAEQEKRKALESTVSRQLEVIEIKDRHIEQLLPDAEYAKTVLVSSSTFTTTQIAKEFGFGAPTLNEKLRRMGIQYKLNGQWLLYAKYQDKGYTATNTYSETINGEVRTYHSTVWTEKGRLFIHQALNAKTA